MSEEEKSEEEAQKELAFYRNQTKVLREKNRDLRNALLLAESQQEPSESEETAQESLSDIRKIISDSKKQITEKLSQFKETLNDSDITAESTVDPTGAPAPPKHSTQMDGTEIKPSQPAAPLSAEADVLFRQVDYLKQEIDRLETFLEQSEMVNNRLQELLSKHNIDVSEITKAINEASKTAVSPKAIQKLEPVATLAVTTPAVPEKIEPKPEPKPKPKPKELDPAIVKLFDNFKAKMTKRIKDEDIKLEILNLREELMDLIPHSRVFYEMQVEYRRWKRGSSSKDELKEAIKLWEATIASL
ncbi:MAG: hypothetical protein E3J70_05505 [Candidatus Heimdallarchaeota archaeon]|nr:MAG: hypothetical protein E3J70_05505 [Candidatus Heimdallarchaeota archaeon]